MLSLDTSCPHSKSPWHALSSIKTPLSSLLITLTRLVEPRHILPSLRDTLTCLVEPRHTLSLPRITLTYHEKPRRSSTSLRIALTRVFKPRHDWTTTFLTVQASQSAVRHSTASNFVVRHPKCRIAPPQRQTLPYGTKKCRTSLICHKTLPFDIKKCHMSLPTTVWPPKVPYNTP